MSNRLAQESSPYLRQHMNNPVDWYAWGPEALAASKAQDKPILLSVGYAACHWCHVMEHESFEDARTAELMNELFINIKVDREERPDIDHIYMAACQLFTGSGGWPLTVFLTPDLRPFFSGTYFPREDRYGRPGFKRVLQSLASAFKDQRSDVEEQAARFHRALRGLTDGPKGEGELDASLIARGAEMALKRFDPEHGGFGHAPKFPNTLDLLLLEQAARRGNQAAGDASLLTCRKMVDGGIHDQLGGGFHRYSVDERWAVPHFEKMTYDNALIPRVLLAAFRRTRQPWLRDAVEDLVAYVRREMTSADGAFFATQDADSEGEEGRFFGWTPAQVEEVLGKDAVTLACLRWGITAEGNFEHHATVLHRARTEEDVATETGRDLAEVSKVLARARRQLFDAREQRVKPARDEKVLAGWNGLMISALADAASTLRNPEHLTMATHALDFVLARMRTADGGVLRVFAGGAAKIPGFLEDYAFVAQACCDVHRAGGGTRYLQAAVDLGGQLLKRFHGEDGRGFYATEDNAPDLLVRARSTHDDALPSGASVAAGALWYAGNLTGNAAFKDAVEDLLDATAAELANRPTAYASLLLLAQQVLQGSPQVLVAGGNAAALLADVRALSEPWVQVAHVDEDRAVLATSISDGKTPVDGAAAAYVCANMTCQAPAGDEAALRAALRQVGLPAAG